MILLAVLWGAPLMIFALGVMSAKQSQLSATSGAKPKVVTVGSREIEGRRAVTLTARMGAVPRVTTAAQGIVTRIHIAAGQQIDNGALLLDVDGKGIRAFADELPLFRDLAVGDSGADVAGLSRFLAATGHLDPSSVDERIGPRIHSAIIAFQEDTGYEPDGVFRPAYAAYTPPGFGAMTSLAVTLGQRLDGESALFAGSATPSAIEADSPDPDRTTSDESSSFVLRIGKERATLTAWPPSAGDIGTVWSALVEGASRGDLKRTSTSSDDGVEVRFEGAQLSYQRPITVGTVPASAVFTSVTGVSCVFVTSTPGAWKGKDAKAHVIDASADRGEPGQALVQADLVGASVARDSMAVDKQVRAACK